MDLTSLMSALLSDNSINSVSGKAGVSAGDTAGVLAAALPMLLNGANAQAQNADTAESFHVAVSEHAAKDPEKVDLAEGEKIVEHLLGDDEAAAEKAIAKKTGLSKAQVALILAAAAPLLMNMLGGHTTSNNSTSANSTASLMSALLGGGNSASSGNGLSNALATAALGAVLSSALNGNNKPQASNSSILGSVLSSAMGVKPQQQVIQQPVSSGTSSLLGSLMGAALGGNSQPTHTIQQVQPVQQAPSADLGSLAGLLGSLLK